jgi:hypothetical protein
MLILGAKLGRVCLRNAHTLYQLMLTQSPEYARRPRCRNAAIDMYINDCRFRYN